MSTIRLVAQYLFPSEKQVLLLYRRFFPRDAPKWLEPSLWIANVSVLLALYALLIL